jgi:ferrous iron transport protein B
MANLTIALAGNPNSGKSTVFNALTGLHQHTGNWPGKTVEKKTGRCQYQDLNIEFVDLPGTYSLSAYSPDEKVARDFLIGEHPDGVICVVDATNLERNLYLVVQLLELGIPVSVALNMMDQAQTVGIDVDCSSLSRLLGGVPVIATAASRSKGLNELLATTVDYLAQQSSGESGLPGVAGKCHCDNGDLKGFQVNYGSEIELAIDRLELTAESSRVPLNGYCRRWMALELLEGDLDLTNEAAALPGGELMIKAASCEIDQLESEFGDHVDMITADARYTAVSGISRQVMKRNENNGPTLTERVDRFATNRLVGLPIFLAIMYLVFRLVIDVSAPYLDWVDSLISGPVSLGIGYALSQIGAADWLISLAVDGVVAGVGGVLTFVPGLITLFFFLALLEDSGYLARAAFVMDRLMRFIGLHGKSVIPLMLGFGCAVPAVYATRTIANHRNRLLTALLIPFMSCSARLPVYVVFALAFFGARASIVIWLMYVIGVIVAILMGLILSRTVLKPDENTAFVLELPPYRMPTAKTLLIHTWENLREFLREAGTVILAISIVVWFLLNLPWGVTNQQESLFGRASNVIAPAFEPAGFGDWQASGALLTGFIAKELVVSSFSQVYIEDEESNSSTTVGSPNPADISSTVGEELTAIIVGFGQATVDSGLALISLIPGINLQTSDDVVEDTSLSRALEAHFTPLSAFAFLIFVLLYIPCLATIAAIRQEFGGKWAATSAIYQTVVAWLVTVLIFQAGKLAGLG